MIDLRIGDCRAILAAMPDNSVDSVVTDPPYELGFMGRAWDSTGIANDPALWSEVLRVLKPGGHMVAFSGTRTYHRMACAIEDAGFEVRDQLAWVYGSGFPKSLDVAKAIDKAAGEAEQWQGWGTALKPAWEPICLARKPLIGTVVANVLAHGTGALNVDGCRVESNEVTGWAGARAGSADATQSQGRNYRMAAGEARPVFGRFPANLCHDGSDEVLELFPESTPAGNVNRTNQPVGFSGATRTAQPINYRDPGSAARFFYCAKASAGERGTFCRQCHAAGVPQPDCGHLNADGKPDVEGHATVKPQALMRWLVRLITPPGGNVLDPFAGSGSTLLAADVEGFDVIGCELSADYGRIVEARIEAGREPKPARKSVHRRPRAAPEGQGSLGLC